MAAPAPDYSLRTSRLGFRLWRKEDLPLAMAIWGDPQVTRFVGGPFSAEQVKEKLDREITNMEQHGVEYWPVFLLANGEHAGCAGLRPSTRKPRVLGTPELRPPRVVHEAPGGAGRPGKEFEMGFYLRPHYWGVGLAEEAGRGVINYAFSSLGAGSLFAAHHPENAASGRVLEKLGFRFTHEELYPPTGLKHRVYALVK